MCCCINFLESSKIKPQIANFFDDINHIININDTELNIENYGNYTVKSIRSDDFYCEYNECGKIKFCLYQNIHQTFHDNGQQKIIMNFNDNTYVEYDHIGNKIIVGFMNKFNNNEFSWLRMTGSWKGYYECGKNRLEFTRLNKANDYLWIYKSYHKNSILHENIVIKSCRRMNILCGCKLEYVNKYYCNDNNGNIYTYEKSEMDENVMITTESKINGINPFETYNKYIFNIYDKNINLKVQSSSYDSKNGLIKIPKKTIECDCNIKSVCDNKNIPDDVNHVIHKITKLYDYLETFGTLSNEYIKSINVDMTSYKIKKLINTIN